jgi:Bacterial Ig domain/FG-GAP repeat
LQQQLFASDGVANEFFGNAVSINGDTIVIGDSLDDIGTKGQQGSVYVYGRSGASWIQQQKLTAGDGNAGDEFGHSVAIATTGDMIVVGAHGNDTGSAGSIYLFTQSGTSWIQQQQLIAGDYLFGDQLGWSVAISGSTVVSGDRLNGGINAGAVYIFGVANNLPVASDDTGTTTEDTAVTIPVLGNDTDPDVGNTLTVTSVTQGSNGSVTNHGDGTVTYTPNANFNGTDSFTYTVSDSNGGTDTATVAVTITAVNDAPSAMDDAATTIEDMPVTISALDNDTDVEGNTLTVSGVTQPANGSVIINANGTLTYTPTVNFNGSDLFGYVVNDGNGGGGSATVGVTVTAVNDVPVAGSDNYSVNEDTPLNMAAPGLLGNDNDVDSSGLSAVLVSGPANGELSLNANGSLSYTPSANFNGSDSFTYRVSDGAADSNTATVTITVNPVNDPPDAVNDSASTNQYTAVVISVLSNDTDIEGHTLTVVGVTQGANGAVLINPNGTVTYTPNANFSGGDSFTYTLSDGNGGTDTASVSLTLILVNQRPVANTGGPYSVDEGSSVTVTATGSDPEGGALLFAWDLDDNGSFETPGQSASFSAAGVLRQNSIRPVFSMTSSGCSPFVPVM